MTNILDLWPYQISDAVGPAEDWIAAFSYTNGAAPCDLSGIAFSLTLSSAAHTPLTLGTSTGELQIVQSEGSSVSDTLLIAASAQTLTPLAAGENYSIVCKATADGHTRNVLLGRLYVRPAPQ
ncbi:hypothetical protein GJ654_18885 [Rhodoblastus acidophilus]|uniref:Uncharacterized protein n=1 Tax=Rhodoblastus acidophilus TaxID=1074 RepID=A0A6N8DR54_RHOAC|nr:hypothetical protein [Rhodoblastus acidophilus]MCW2276395.1 hypothetical protein [Rhodoblastus acidophilus]MTV33050.1 hypothetical protein [Rhodoblastus acidophilus]